MNFTPHNIFDYRDREYAAKYGYLTFRLYADGWLVRFTPFDNTAGIRRETIEGQDVTAACAFANARLA